MTRLESELTILHWFSNTGDMGELTVTTSRASTRSSLYPVQPASAKANSTEYKHHCRQGCISQEEETIHKCKRKDIFQENKSIFQESFTSGRGRTCWYCVVREVLECISSHCCLLFLRMHLLVMYALCYLNYNAWRLLSTAFSTDFTYCVTLDDIYLYEKCFWVGNFCVHICYVYCYD